MIDIKSIATEFENKRLPKEQWTHLAHIAVAFALFDRYKDIDQSLSKMRALIKDYNVSVGTENTESSGYHETLTIFWLKVVAEFYTAKCSTNIQEVYHLFTSTILASSSFPTKFYTKDLLFSIGARQIWTEPNLLPISEIQVFVSENMG